MQSAHICCHRRCLPHRPRSLARHHAAPPRARALGRRAARRPRAYIQGADTSRVAGDQEPVRAYGSRGRRLRPTLPRRDVRVYREHMVAVDGAHVGRLRPAVRVWRHAVRGAVHRAPLSLAKPPTEREGRALSVRRGPYTNGSAQRSLLSHICMYTVLYVHTHCCAPH
jgi:hypothetical protein